MRSLYLTLVDRALGQDPKSFEAFISANALITGISLLSDDMGSYLHVTSVSGHILLPWMISILGPFFLVAFTVQCVGCVFNIFSDWRIVALRWRRGAALMRTAGWIAFSIYLFFFTEGMWRIDWRYLTFLIFDLWAMMTLFYRSE